MQAHVELDADQSPLPAYFWRLQFVVLALPFFTASNGGGGADAERNREEKKIDSTHLELNTLQATPRTAGTTLFICEPRPLVHEYRSSGCIIVIKYSYIRPITQGARIYYSE